MKTALVVCGALAREVLDIARRHAWDVDVVGVSALDHLYPERIAPDVETQLRDLNGRYQRVIVVYGDCGSKGALDQLLDRYEVERVAGPHCYEMYGGAAFQELLAEEPGTFFLTDFLVRAFRGAVIRGLGLDQFPELKADYFRNYRRIVYLAQTHDPELQRQARQVADYLDLPLETRHTGYGRLEERLVALMAAGRPARPLPPLPSTRIFDIPASSPPRTRRRRRGRRPAPGA